MLWLSLNVYYFNSLGYGNQSPVPVNIDKNSYVYRLCAKNGEGRQRFFVKITCISCFCRNIKVYDLSHFANTIGNKCLRFVSSIRSLFMKYWGSIVEDNQSVHTLKCTTIIFDQYVPSYSSLAQILCLFTHLLQRKLQP